MAGAVVTVATAEVRGLLSQVVAGFVCVTKNVVVAAMVFAKYVVAGSVCKSVPPVEAVYQLKVGEANAEESVTEGKPGPHWVAGATVGAAGRALRVTAGGVLVAVQPVAVTNAVVV